MSSALSFTFRPSLIPAQYQAEFITRFAQLVLDYEILTEPVLPSPPAESVPQPPSSFAPVEGDGADGEVPPTGPVAATKVRKNPWAGLTEEQRAEKIAAMKRGRAAKAERRISADSLEAPTEALPAPLVAPVEAVAAPVADTASETSSKKSRKNPWANLSPEERAVKVANQVAAMRAGKEAKKAALLAAAV